MLIEILHSVARRYRVPVTPTLPTEGSNPAAMVTAAIEAARASIDQGIRPDPATKQCFLEALALLIRSAMQANAGDPVFQAMVLEHLADPVREYASLAAQITQDRRMVMAAVNAVAHPAKQERVESTWMANILAQLHTAASSSQWSTLADTAQRLRESTQMAGQPDVARSLARLEEDGGLQRLLRLEALESNPLVQRYKALRTLNGPAAGSADAAMQGATSKKKGAATEALAAQAVQQLANWLNGVEGSENAYRVVTSLRVPAALQASAAGAKLEWDVVLLRRLPIRAIEGSTKVADNATVAVHPNETGQAPQGFVWEISLLVEAKASADAAATDFPRLLRGMRLLAQADRDTIYSFDSRQGIVSLHGASLQALKVDENELQNTVLYCCDAPAEAPVRALNPASRMQLLCAPASLQFAGKVACRQPAHSDQLEPVWQQLLESAQWRPVLHQYQSLRQVRQLMVHPDDLISATAALSPHHKGRSDT